MTLVHSAIRHGKSAYWRTMLPRSNRALPSLTSDPLVVAGMFQTSNGIGRAAQVCYTALKHEGFCPIAVDLSRHFNQAEHNFDLTLEHMPTTKRGTLLLFANAPETRRALTVLGLRRWHGWRIIGCWAWELPTAPAEWRNQIKHHSEIWVPSEFVRDSMGSFSDIPVHVVPHHVPVNLSEPINPLTAKTPGSGFQFLSMADGRSSFHRKNLTATIRMFKQAFPDDKDVSLVMKCRNLDLYPNYARDLHNAASEDPRLKLIDGTLAPDDIDSMFRESDVVVSSHRSEGFGFVMAEAMAMGRPVIATGWSGNLQFMTEQNSRLLPYTLETVNDPTGVYSTARSSSWAVVDESAGTRAMRELHANPSLCLDIGMRAQQDIGHLLNRSVYTRALLSPKPSLDAVAG